MIYLTQNGKISADAYRVSGTLVDVCNWLYIKCISVFDSDEDHPEPWLRITYRKTGWRVCNTESDLLGAEVKYMSNNVWQTTDYRPYGYTRCVQFASDGINPELTEELAILKPKTRAGIETRWERYAWQKYLKTKGWVNL